MPGKVFANFPTSPGVGIPALRVWIGPDSPTKPYLRKFNSSPLKIYLPIKKVGFQPPFFRGVYIPRILGAFQLLHLDDPSKNRDLSFPKLSRAGAVLCFLLDKCLTPHASKQK